MILLYHILYYTNKFWRLFNITDTNLMKHARIGSYSGTQNGTYNGTHTIEHTNTHWNTRDEKHTMTQKQ